MITRHAVPSLDDVAREAAIVICGAILAAVIVAQMPGLKAWLKKQWDETPNPLNPF